VKVQQPARYPYPARCSGSAGPSAAHLVVRPASSPAAGRIAVGLVPCGLRNLPAAQREVIALHHLADLTVEQVADTLALPTGTVKARLSRGRAALSTLLVKEGPHV
jgi:RNA polymerase sigma-70 factor (ECF subfamily)